MRDGKRARRYMGGRSFEEMADINEQELAKDGMPKEAANDDGGEVGQRGKVKEDVSEKKELEVVESARSEERQVVATCGGK